jgi:hypothetical protein
METIMSTPTIPDVVSKPEPARKTGWLRKNFVIVLALLAVVLAGGALGVALTHSGPPGRTGAAGVQGVQGMQGAPGKPAPTVTKTVIKTVAPASAPSVSTPAAASDPGYLNPVTLANSIAAGMPEATYTVQCDADGTDQFTCVSNGGFEGTSAPFTTVVTVSPDGTTYTLGNDQES